MNEILANLKTQFVAVVNGAAARLGASASFHGDLTGDSPIGCTAVVHNDTVRLPVTLYPNLGMAELPRLGYGRGRHARRYRLDRLADAICNRFDILVKGAIVRAQTNARLALKEAANKAALESVRPVAKRFGVELASRFSDGVHAVVVDNVADGATNERPFPLLAVRFSRRGVAITDTIQNSEVGVANWLRRLELYLGTD